MLPAAHSLGVECSGCQSLTQDFVAHSIELLQEAGLQFVQVWCGGSIPRVV